MHKKNKFKFLTFLAGLITLLLALALIACCGYIGFVIFPDILSQGDNVSVAIVGVLLLPVLLAFLAVGLTVSIIYVVLGIMLVTSSFKDDKVYKNRRSFVIFTIVSDFIMITNLLFLAYAINENVKILFIIVSAVILLVSIMKIIVLILFKKKAKKVSSQQVIVDIDDEMVKPIQPNKNVNFDALKEERYKNLDR